MWFVVTALDEIACECSGFTVGRVTQSLSWFSGNLCVHRIQFSAWWRISKRPSPVGIWHAKWDGEGIILDGELQGIGEETWLVWSRITARR